MSRYEPVSLSDRKYAVLPSNHELLLLLREHGTFAGVARVLGCSNTAVAYRCNKMGIKSPNRKGGRRFCDRCHESSEDRTVIRFGLIVSATGAFGRTTRGGGSIYLCQECWRETGGARLDSKRRLIAKRLMAATPERGRMLVERAGSVRAALKQHHPDLGGNPRDFAAVQKYRERVA